LYLLQNYDAEPTVKVGWGEDLTIRELAETVMSANGYTGSLTFDHSKPGDTPRKLLDVSRLQNLGWRSRMPLQTGIEDNYAWFKEHVSDARL
jgi:GDP-L-fucose synthase